MTFQPGLKLWQISFEIASGHQLGLILPARFDLEDPVHLHQLKDGQDFRADSC